MMTAAALLLAACGGAPDVKRGAHLATVMGCVSCHGAALDGHLFEENPAFAVAWSSNLSRILPRWSDARIEAALRMGRRADGTALWFMPTFAQSRLTPADMRYLIAWLRSVPPSGVDHPAIVRGPQFAVAIDHGFLDSAAQAEKVATRQPVRVPGAQQGRYLASIACAECHGPDLKGVKDARPGDPPDLAVAGAYSPAAFARLLKTGIKADGGPANEMIHEAPKRLSALTNEEITAIKRYLEARAAR
jgi:mono/diheme cytochrome c family protein